MPECAAACSGEDSLIEKATHAYYTLFTRFGSVLFGADAPPTN
jgi:hypothetical protein